MVKEKVAVIFVPGIFASHLFDPKNEYNVWELNSYSQDSDSLKNAAMIKQVINYSPNKKRKMMADSHRFEVGGSLISPEGSWKSVGLAFYKPFLEDCHKNSKLAFEPIVWGSGYNFTQSNKESSKQILQMTKIALRHDQAAAKKFIIVTHSMGALPTRYMLKHHTVLGRHCLGVIHVVAPNGGSPEFIGRYFRGFQEGNPVTLIIMGKQGWRVATAASAVQGAYELFPFANPNATKVINAPPPSATRDSQDVFFLHDITDHAFSHPEDDHDFRKHFRDASNSKARIHLDIFNYNRTAKDFHGNLGNYIFANLNGQNKTAAVCLTDKETVQDVTYLFDQSNGNLITISENKTSDGDGTVPLWSQKMFLDGKTVSGGGLHSRPACTVIPGGLDHSDAFNNKGKEAGVFDAVYAYMERFYRQAKKE